MWTCSINYSSHYKWSVSNSERFWATKLDHGIVKVKDSTNWLQKIIANLPERSTFQPCDENTEAKTTKIMHSNILSDLLQDQVSQLKLELWICFSQRGLVDQRVLLPSGQTTSFPPCRHYRTGHKMLAVRCVTAAPRRQWKVMKELNYLGDRRCLASYLVCW